MSKIIRLSQLRVGQRFSFIPSEWYGQCRLTRKDARTEYVDDPKGVSYFSTKPVTVYDIKFDANVVNPPGVIYGMSADTKVRLLSPKPRRQTKGHRPVCIV